MAGKYSISIKRSAHGPKGEETFTITGCDSFEEALKKVEKGIYDRELSLGAEKPAGEVKKDLEVPSNIPENQV